MHATISQTLHHPAHERVRYKLLTRPFRGWTPGHVNCCFCLSADTSTWLVGIARVRRLAVQHAALVKRVAE